MALERVLFALSRTLPGMRCLRTEKEGLLVGEKDFFPIVFSHFCGVIEAGCFIRL